MGTKNNPGDYDCHAHADPDEPLFTLLGRDPAASVAVRYWIAIREEMGGTAPEKLEEARKCVDQMERWAQAAGKDVNAAYTAHRRVIAKHAGH